ncbi:hypothetical protein [Nesterenkonia sp. HG001]|uniref:hypothetical protein n=1 Tax=Nesterenkonia sp. HG001 TaxID=2983207 RepID=UPI002AC523F3|nr:hypothetical protein [Nesterenkonia sp. HG001]MDZ5076390.1 hypothetical protein [Nesterenkonia sp. HG001]
MTTDALLLLAANPLVPTGWEASVGFGGILHLALLIWALVRVYRCPALAFSWKLLCVVAALSSPFLGPIVVILVIRGHRRRVDSGELAGTVMAPPLSR